MCVHACPMLFTANWQIKRNIQPCFVENSDFRVKAINSSHLQLTTFPRGLVPEIGHAAPAETQAKLYKRDSFRISSRLLLLFIHPWYGICLLLTYFSMSYNTHKTAPSPSSSPVHRYPALKQEQYNPPHPLYAVCLVYQ